MSLKNILILTEAMLPFCNNWGSCQRVYHYSLQLISEGYNVHIICRNFSTNSAGTVEYKSIKVTTPDPAKKSSPNNESFRSKVINFFKRNQLVLSFMQKVYRVLYSEPNLFRGKESKRWAYHNKEFIKKYIVDHKIDFVFISGPPFGLFYLADEIKSLGVKLILDYRDPWNLWYEKYSLAEKHEYSAIESADLVIASTDDLSEALAKKYQKKHIYPILNGYDVSAWETQRSIPKNKEKLVISYVGYILVNSPPAFRDPRCFIESACEFLENKKDVEVRVIGVGDDLSSIRENYKSKIFFQNTVSLEEALKEVNQSDVLLVIHTAKDSSGNYIVCGKLYDYLRSGKYILSVGDQASCNNKLIDRYHLGIHCSNNKKSIIESLEQIYYKWKNDFLTVEIPEDIIKYSRVYQNKKIVTLLNDLKEKKND